MTIFLKQFGSTLTGRQFGKEAFAAFLPSLNNIEKTEKIEVDFEEVNVFTPSWGDEFLSPLLKKFNDRVVLKNTQNPSVKITLELLEDIYKIKFNKRKLT